MAEGASNRSRGPQSTHWTFTVFGYTTLVTMKPSSVGYIVFQEEMAPDTGSPHIQGYLQVSRKQRGSWVTNKLRKWFSVPSGGEEGQRSVHSEAARGSDVDNFEYCTKEATRLGGPYEYGVRVPHAGKRGGRSDLLAVKKLIDDGASMGVVRENYFGDWIRHGKMFSEYKRLKTEPRNFKSQVYLFIGPAGVGKSTMMKIFATHILGMPFFKARTPKGSGLYWDDYDGEEVIIVDEMDGDVMKPKFFNQLCDEHELVLPIHGNAGYQCRARYILLGTNYLPRQWWKNRNAAQLKQTTRRIHVTFKMGFKYEVLDGAEAGAAPPLHPLFHPFAHTSRSSQLFTE